MASTDQLGAVVLAQRRNYVPAIALIAIGTLLALLGTAITLGAGEAVFLAILGGLGAICLAAGIFMIQRKRAYSAVLHERGLREVRNGLERILLYQNVEELSFRSTRVSLNGVYVGTTEDLSLQSADFGRAPFKFRNEYKEKAGIPPVTIAGLSDRIAADMARRVKELLRREGRMNCGPRVAMTARGLELAGKGSVAWDKIARHELQHGKFRLWLKDEAKPALEISTGSPNFLPFYRLLIEQIPA